MSNIMSNESFINRVEGLADVLDTTITKVTLNGSEMETEPFAKLWGTRQYYENLYGNKQ